MATVPLVRGRGRTSNSWRKTLLYFGTRNRKNVVSEEGAKSPEKVPQPMGLLVWKTPPSGFFHNFGNLVRPLESISVSRKRVVPTEWQVRGDYSSSASISTT